ncbi:MAG: hydroxymethylbilane synthase [Chloroflexi bacterium]|nr:hydroxymethylbilane synthase [Chloroflexota bacterium]
MTTIVIGTRGSALARGQTYWVAARLMELVPGLEVIIRTIKTSGDALLDVPLAKIGDKGLFTREIESALLAGQIDVAVHSLKDLPTELSAGLIIGAVTEREDVRDALVSRLGCDLDGLPPGARVGTSSLRRAAQLLAYRPDLQILNIRGNVDTRLRKAATEEYDAVVLAVAGLRRLGLEAQITEYLPLEIMLPAVGQGALAVEARQEEAETQHLVALLDHAPTRAATTAERVFLRALGGGCRVPIAAYGEVAGDTLRLRGLVASEDGRRVVRGEVIGLVGQAGVVGERLARQLQEEKQH